MKYGRNYAENVRVKRDKVTVMRRVGKTLNKEVIFQKFELDSGEGPSTVAMSSGSTTAVSGEHLIRSTHVRDYCRWDTVADALVFHWLHKV